MRRAILVIAVLVVLGCEQRPPVNAYQAAAIADSYLDHLGEDWGPRWEILPPPDPDARRPYYQVAYAPDPVTAEPRLVLVNRRSGWPRLPPQDWQRRVAEPGLEARYPSMGHYLPGDQILVISDSEGGVEDLAASAQALNKRLVADGLPPLVSCDGDHPGGPVLVYGRTGRGGIPKTPAIREWFEANTPYRDFAWVRLVDPPEEGMEDPAPGAGGAGANGEKGVLEGRTGALSDTRSGSFRTAARGVLTRPLRYTA